MNYSHIFKISKTFDDKEVLDIAIVWYPIICRMYVNTYQYAYTFNQNKFDRKTLLKVPCSRLMAQGSCSCHYGIP